MELFTIPPGHAWAQRLLHGQITVDYGREQTGSSDLGQVHGD